MGEMSHFMLGVVTTPMSQEIHYGDKSCLVNPDLGDEDQAPDDLHCYDYANSSS